MNNRGFSDDELHGNLLAMSRIVGIDLGTTNSLVATVDSGIPLVIADAEGRRLTPSVVHFPGDTSLSQPQQKSAASSEPSHPSPRPLPVEGRGSRSAAQISGPPEPVVGVKANRVRVVRPEETVYSIKRFMGRRGNEISREEMLVTYPVRGEGAGPAVVEIHGRKYSPEEISAEVLKKLRRDAEEYFGEPVTRAVITVPAYFNDAQRNATKKAGELAGLTVERIINEPTAAALAYGLDKLKEHARIAVYDLGGGTFDLSILELKDGVFQVLSTNGNTRLGGDDLDKRLIDFLVEKIKATGGPDATKDFPMLSRIREAAEEAKIKLSAETEVEVALPFLTPQFSFSQKLIREQLEDLTRDIIARTRPHCLRALADSKLEAKDLDQVILVGGQTRMPLVRRVVSEIFGCAEFDEVRGGIRLGTEYHRGAGPVLNTSQNPDEAVALGAAIQAEILSGGFKNVLLLDVTPLSLGIETFGGLMNVIIHRNSTIPVKAGEMFTTAIDNQKNMLIHVLQGERERAKDNWSLGKFTIDFEPAPKGVPRIGVQFEIDASGILHVLARDTKTGKQTVVEMKSAVDVEDADVQRMVEESVEHAFEDLAARRWIEASLSAKEVLAATRKGLANCGDEFSGNQREQIEAALTAVEAVLASAESQNGAGDVQKLKSASGALDTATQPLAELMMDRAMEGWLRKKGMIQ